MITKLKVWTVWLCLAVILPANAQNVNVNSTGGTGFATYATLNAAFTAINNGVHTGQILVAIANNTNEGATMASLNNSGSGSANYTKVYITPSSPGVTISGNPNASAAVVRLNRASNVTINGTLNGGNSGSRDLTITSANGNTNTAVIWLQSAGTAQGCTNDTIMNCNITGGSNTTASVFGIIAAGTTLSTTGSGADNDNLAIRNNQFSTCYYGIFARGTAAGTLGGLLIANNIIGTTNASTYVTFAGIDLQQTSSAVVRNNEIRNQVISTNFNASGITVGTGASGVVIDRNIIYGQQNTTNGGSGAYGINITAGTGVQINHNHIYGVMAAGFDFSSTTGNAFGIRIAGGTNHLVYYNTVHLYGTANAVVAPAMAACFVVTTNTVTGLNVRNNLFQNKISANNLGGRMYAMHLPSGFNFGSSTFNYNAYMVPSSNTANTTYAPACIGSVDKISLAALRTTTTQDANSVPDNNQLAPFLADNDYHINTGVSNPLESGGINIGSNTTDFEGQIRQGNPGYSQSPAGTGPDIGADEFAQTPGVDFTAPVLTNVSPATPTNNCVGLSHTVTCTATGGIASIVIEFSAGGINQTPITMNNTTGNNYSGTIPSQGGNVVMYRIKVTDNSVNQNTTYSDWYTYQDAFMSINTGLNQSICTGSSVTLNAVITYPANIKISDITQFRTGTGPTNPYPAWATGEDMVEISNFGNVHVDVSGMKLEVKGGTIRDFTIPPGTILPASSVMVIHLGPGVDSPANRYFNAGGANDDISSGDPTGYVLKRFANGPVVDAVGTNGYTFDGYSGVTAADWSGSVASSLNYAGIKMVNNDDNASSDWSITSTAQTIGALNAGVMAPINYVFSWTPGGSTNPTLTVSPTNNTNYTANISNGFCNASDQVTVSVLSIPGAPVTTNDTICGLNVLQLLASGTDTLKWFDASTGGNLVNLGTSYSPNLAQTDTFYVMSTNGTCSSARVMVIGVVNTAPPVVTSIMPASACTYTTIALAVSSGNGQYSYTWTGNGLQSSTGPSVNAYPTQSGYYVVTANDGTCLTRDSVQFTGLPAPFTTLTPTNGTACPGASILLEPFTQTGGNNTYSWTSSPAGFSSAQDTVQVNPTQTTIYTLVITSLLNNCTYTVSDTIPVYGGVTASVNDGAVCAGTPFTAAASFSGGDGNFTYQWSNGSNQVSSINVSPSVTTNYIFTVSDGCSQTASDTTTVTVFQLPVVNLGSDTAVCGPWQLDAGNPGNSFSWQDLSTQQTFQATSSGLYYVSVTDGNNCVGKDSIQLTVNPVPTVTLSLSPSSACVSDGLIALSGGSPSGGTFGGSFVSGGNLDAGAAGIGTHQVIYQYTDQNSCSSADTAAFVVYDCLGLEENETPVMVYPNPVADFMTIVWTKEAWDVEIYNAAGQKIFTAQHPEGMETFQLMTADWMPGIYILRLHGDAQQIVHRFIKY